MIIDLHTFVTEERRYWAELESILDRMERDPSHQLDLEQLKHFHYLYQRASADLAKIMTFAAEPQIRRYLELLVARAYGEIHETRERTRRLNPLRWFFRTFPQTFRRHARAFGLAAALTAMGAVFGGVAVSIDPEAKNIIIPFPHLQGDPSQRVAREESTTDDRLAGHKSQFSTMLMTHNTRVSILVLAMGITYGVGTIIILFYNGVILGAVTLDYMLGNQTRFLFGWLMPHGAIEIPAILIAGQAGLVLASALIGWSDRSPLKLRMRRVGGDLVTLVAGAAVLLVWAGMVEAFLSQYHEPVFPYWLKIGFGAVELGLLTMFLARSGVSTDADGSHQHTPD